MDDLVSLLIFAGIFIFSLIAGGKKKKAQGQRPPVRPRPQAGASPSPMATPARRPPPSQPLARATPARQQQPGGEPQELVEGLLDLLRGRIPIEMQPQDTAAGAQAEIDDEVQQLENAPLDREKEHQEFHDKYVQTSVPATVTSGPRSRYRLTPKTAREAVVWTAIFTKPKGME